MSNLRDLPQLISRATANGTKCLGCGAPHNAYTPSPARPLFRPEYGLRAEPRAFYCSACLLDLFDEEGPSYADLREHAEQEG